MLAVGVMGIGRLAVNAEGDAVLTRPNDGVVKAITLHVGESVCVREGERSVLVD